MKRHDALTPFSRDHHETLILAQLLKKGAPGYKGLPVDKEGKIIYALELFREKMVSHFAAEESMIEALKSIPSKSLSELGEQIRNEHNVIRSLFEKLSASSTDDELDFLGKTIELHVRKEERIFFPMIEELAPAEWMQELNKVLRH
jgi:iron-sulfur cluster repair protein YtfE (RIC family)